MNEKDMRKLIDDLNQDKVKGYIVTRPLTDTVDFAKFWPKKPSITDPINSNYICPHTFYFIKDKSNKYIGAVVDMENNLKCYVLPECRKSNQLGIALKESILPHLLQFKPLQRISLTKSELGEKTFVHYKKLALFAGMKLIKEENDVALFALEASSLGEREYIAGKNTNISTERLEQITQEVRFMINLLEVIKTEYEFKLGKLILAEELSSLMEDLKVQAQILNDF